MNNSLNKETLIERLSIINESIRLEKELSESNPPTEFQWRVNQKDAIISLTTERDEIVRQLNAIESNNNSQQQT